MDALWKVVLFTCEISAVALLQIDIYHPPRERVG